MKSMTMVETLVDNARLVYAWQSQKGLKDAQMLRKFAGLGSAKTYRDLRDGKVDGYDVERWSSEYAMVLGEIEISEQEVSEEEVMTDLSMVVQLRRAALGAMATNGSNRVVIVLAPSGGGKSFGVKALRKMYGSRVIPLEALDAWNDKPGKMMADMLEACGIGYAPNSPTACFKSVVAELKRSRRMFAIDEAHHMGPHCLNTIKALVNNTPGEFMLLAMETLWNKLETTAYQEAVQISKNRLFERVVFELDVNDIARYVHHRFAGIKKSELGKMAGLVKQAADGNGHYSFVRGVCNRAAEMMGEEPVLSLETVVEAVKAEGGKRRKPQS